MYIVEPGISTTATSVLHGEDAKDVASEATTRLNVLRC